MWQTSLSGLVETALNTYLKLDPLWREHYQKLAGASLAVDIVDWDLSLYFLMSASHIDVLSAYEDMPDARIKGKSADLFSLRNDDTQRSVHQGEVAISGKLELAQKFKTLFDDTHIDWESYLAKYLGEMGAYQTGKAVKASWQWGKETHQSMQLNLSEYLQEEARHLPPKLEAQDFFADVAELRSDVARMEARIKKLERDLGV